MKSTLFQTPPTLTKSFTLKNHLHPTVEPPPAPLQNTLIHSDTANRMSSSKRWNLFTGNGGCGCGMKPTDVFEPKPKPKTSLFLDQNPTHSSSSSSSDRQQPITDDDGSCTSTTFSLDIDKSPENHRHHHSEWPKRVTLCRTIQDSVAVIKDSNDPYHDFRQSMLQMIFENEIYSRSGLQQLLHCFLDLNSPRHHHVIVQAFVDVIRNGGCLAVADGSDDEAPPPEINQ